MRAHSILTHREVKNLSKQISIGGGQGFWGDSNDAAIHMIRTAELDYMACDYLAELTLSIMQRQKLKNPQAGYARDFLKLMDIIAEEAYKKKVGILTNAGGMNITACVDKLKEMVECKGLRGYKIGYVLGDDLLDRIPELAAEGIKFENMDGIGFNVWGDLQLIGGRGVLDSEDFLVSNLLLPIGSIIYLLFCVSRWGWGFDHYLEEANTGAGPKLPRWLRPYFRYVLPVLIVIILVQGLI